MEQQAWNKKLMELGFMRKVVEQEEEFILPPVQKKKPHWSRVWAIKVIEDES